MPLFGTILQALACVTGGLLIVLAMYGFWQGLEPQGSRARASRAAAEQALLVVERLMAGVRTG